MESFQEFVNYIDSIVFLFEEGIGTYSKENFEKEALEDTKVAFNQIVKYASVPTRQSGKINWLNLNYTYWTRPRKQREMIKKAYEFILNRVFPGFSRGQARVYLRDFITNIWQKDVGFGSRRFAGYAGGLGYTQPMIHPAYPATMGLQEPLVSPRSRGRPAGKYKWIFDPDTGERKLTLVDPRYPSA